MDEEKDPNEKKGPNMKILIVRHGDPDYENDCLTEQGKIKFRGAPKNGGYYSL